MRFDIVGRGRFSFFRILDARFSRLSWFGLLFGKVLYFFVEDK